MSAQDETAWTLETPRLRARRWRESDVDAAFELYGDPEVTRWIGGDCEPDVAAMSAKLRFLIERYQSVPEGMGSWPAFTRDSGRLVAVGLCKPIPDREDRPGDDIEIGWHVLRSEWGQGYATELGKALLDHCRSRLGLSRVNVVVEPPNVASVAVARKLGLDDQGRTTSYYGGIELEHFVWDRGAPE